MLRYTHLIHHFEQGGPGPPNFLNTDVFMIDDSKTKKKLEKS